MPVGQRSMRAARDVAAAWSTLAAELPVIAGAEGVVRFARNGTYVQTDEVTALAAWQPPRRGRARG